MKTLGQIDNQVAGARISCPSTFLFTTQFTLEQLLMKGEHIIFDDNLNCTECITVHPDGSVWFRQWGRQFPDSNIAWRITNEGVLPANMVPKKVW